MTRFWCLLMLSHYLQIFGTSVLIVGKALFTFQPPPRFWKQSMDNTCVALPTNKVAEFHQHLNSFEPSIQFTIELEKGGNFPSLMFFSYIVQKVNCILHAIHVIVPTPLFYRALCRPASRGLFYIHKLLRVR